MWLKIILLVVSLSLSNGKPHNLTKIALMRMESPFQKMLSENFHISVIEEMVKIDRENYYKQFEGPGKPAPVPLFKYLDYEFYGEVLFGSPGQKFKVVFDTLWAFTWIPSILCPVYDISCAMKNKYNGDRSSHSTNLFEKYSIPYGNSELRGLKWKDVVYVNQINVTDQLFIAVSYLPWSLFFTKADGVIGLAPDYGMIPNATPLFINMVKQKKIDKAIFSVYMNRDFSSAKAGTILFGGVDKTHYNGSFTYLKIDQKSGLWSFKMNKIRAGDAIGCANTCDVWIDTSTNIISGPKKDIEAINKNITAEYFGVGRYKVDCGRINRLPPVTLSIGGRDFVLKGKDYVLQMNMGPVTMCFSTFTNGEETNWRLGASFIAKYYVTFDLDNYKIGFADSLM